jgi:DNA polymerase I-like protein with 3'-5' exonuclease and polymerase domains
MITPIAIDTETHKFAPGNMSPKVVCMSWAKSSKGMRCILTGYPIEKEFSLFLDQKCLIIGHNIQYDMRCLIATFPELKQKIFEAYREGRVSCTQIRERLLDIAEDKLTKKGYSLADLAKKYFDEIIEKEDTWRLRYEELEDVPFSDWPRDAIDYSLKDSELALRIWQEQEKRKHKLDYSLPTEKLDVYASFCLGLMHSWGVETDQEYAINLWNEQVKKMTSLAKEIEPSGLMVVSNAPLDLFNNDITKPPKTKKNLSKIRELILKTYPGNPPRTRPSAAHPQGQIKYDAETLEECNHPDLKKLLEFSKIEKNMSMTLSKFVGHPIVHANFHAVGGVSDRTSSSNPNLQQVPQKGGFRECVVPREDHVFLASDFDSQEMRTLGQAALTLVGHSKLASMYQKDRKFDPHTDFAKLVFNTDNPTKEQRQQTKVANFGFPGGLKAKNFVKYAKGWGVTITQQQGQKLLDAWFEQWPEMGLYFDMVQNIVGGADYGTQVIPQSEFRRGGVGYNDCANGYFQTLAAHASKEALCEITYRCYCDRTSALFNSRPVLYVHDEVISETPKHKAEKAAKEKVRIMIKAMEKWTPDVPAASSSKIMDRWVK